MNLFGRKIEALKEDTATEPDSNEGEALSLGTEMVVLPPDATSPRASRSRSALMVDKQYVPPQLDFDDLYLYPTQLTEEAIKAHQAAFREQEKLLVAAQEREKKEGHEADARRWQLNEETRRENERHSGEMARLNNELGSLKNTNRQLSYEVERAGKQGTEMRALESAKAEWEKKYNAECEQTKELREIGSFLGWTALILLVIVGFGAYKYGYSKSTNAQSAEFAQVEEQLTQKSDELQRQNIALEDKNSASDAKIAQLTKRVFTLLPTPTPAVDRPSIQKQIEKANAAIDEAHNDENLTGIFRHFTSNYVLETNGVETLKTDVRSYTAKTYFLPAVLHKEETALVSPGATTDGKGEPLLQIIDEGTAKVKANRTIFTWTMVSPDEPTGGDSTVRAEKTCFTEEQTWVKSGKEWQLAATKVTGVAKTESGLPVPLLRCSLLTCGDTYSVGINPFKEGGQVIKRCPTCNGQLYFVMQ